MRRLFVVLVGAVAALAFATAAASSDYTMKVNGAGSVTVPQGATLTFTGTWVSGTNITIYEYTNSTCTSSSTQVGVPDATDNSGAFSVAYLLPANAAVGAHYYMARSDRGFKSNCVTVTVTAQAAFVPAIPNVFLCYSAFQTDPGVWPITEAAALIKAGYWSPYAVPNTTTGGTNIGGYHLVCNLATGQSAGTSVLGGAGELYGAGATGDVKNVPGHYSVVGP